MTTNDPSRRDAGETDPPMTTPETARTAARETPEWKAIHADLERAPYTNATLADAIYNAVNRSLPEPQASKASEAPAPEFDAGRLMAEIRGNLANIPPEYRVNAVEGDCASLAVSIVRMAHALKDRPSAPAGEAVSVARADLAWLLREFEKSGYRACHTGEMDRLQRAASAPPPSTGDKPTLRCPECGNTAGIEHARYRGQDGCYRMGFFCPNCLDGWTGEPAPTPPPAPASKGETIPVTVTETARLHEPMVAAPLSVAPAREGYTYPDDKVLELTRWLKAHRRTLIDNGYATQEAIMVRLIADLAAARATLPQQGEDDWREKCEVNDAINRKWYVASPRHQKQLFVDGTWGECGDARGYFDTEWLARAALAQAPRPTT